MGGGFFGRGIGVQHIPEKYHCSITKFIYDQSAKKPVVSTTIGFLPLLNCKSQVPSYFPTGVRRSFLKFMV